MSADTYRQAVARLTAASEAWLDWIDAPEDAATDEAFTAIKAEYDKAYAAVRAMLERPRQ